LAAYFFDTSALAKRYHLEEGTARVQAIFAESGTRIVISHLTVVEMRSMFGTKVRTGAIDRATGTALAIRFQSDIAEGLVDVFAITPYDYRRADGLLGRYAFTTRLRSLDALLPVNCR
jgi:hypothetical protein